VSPRTSDSAQKTAKHEGCDYVLPAHQARTAVGLLPHGRLALLPDCGHLPHVEHPDRFAAVLGDWLTEHDVVMS
jgi:pimeloyl-ACP methyl ester carboxylesterase